MVRLALLDTNFILTCMKQKIDFFEDLYLMGIEVLVPKNVISELEKLKKTAALRLLDKSVFKTISLPGKNVDNAIVEYARKNPGVIIGTLDRDMRNKIRNRKITIRNRKKLEII